MIRKNVCSVPVRDNVPYRARWADLQQYSCEDFTSASAFKCTLTALFAFGKDIIFWRYLCFGTKLLFIKPVHTSKPFNTKSPSHWSPLSRTLSPYWSASDSHMHVTEFSSTPAIYFAPHVTHLLADMAGCTICVTSHWRSHPFSRQLQKWLKATVTKNERKKRFKMSTRKNSGVTLGKARQNLHWVRVNYK